MKTALLDTARDITVFRDPVEHPSKGIPDQTWAYRSADGAMLGLACRFNKAGGGKDVLPYFAGKWSHPNPRPLFNLDALAARPDDPVLLVEGEKSAIAAAELFPEYVATTTLGGSSSVKLADLGPLQGRTMTLWPDADEPGQKYVSTIADLLRGKATVSVVDVPDTFPGAWDLADEVPEGVDLKTMLEAAQRPLTTLERIQETKTLDDLEPLLRSLKADIGALDAIGRGLFRERIIEAIKAAPVKVGSAAKLVDAALEPVYGDDLGDEVRDLLLREIIPHDEAVDGVELLDEIRSAVNRYLVLGTAADIAITLWIIHAHAHDATPVSPILAVTSPVKRCGKTTTLELVQSIVPKPLPLNNITAAAMFRVIEIYHPTGARSDGSDDY